MGTEQSVVLDIWSDYVCPFCYLELPAVEQAKSEFGELLEVKWRAFELRPDPVPTLDPDGEYLHDIWGRAVYPMAAERGMNLRLPPVQPRSRKALEAACYARELGLFDAMHIALFRAFFEAGQDIGSIEVLTEIGKSVGIDPSGLQDALRSNRYTGAVLSDESMAARLGVSGVPLGLIRSGATGFERSIAVRGAVPYHHLRQAITHTLNEIATESRPVPDRTNRQPGIHR